MRCSATVDWLPDRDMMRFLATLLLLFGVTFCGTAAAVEHLYVTDRVLADVRTAPDPTGKVLRSIPTGTALTVLGGEGNYVKVETPDGTKGWVLAALLQKEQPAQILLMALDDKYSRTAARLQALEAKREAAQARVEARRDTWLWVAVVAALVLGFLLGVLWIDRRNRIRHGGFRL